MRPLRRRTGVVSTRSSLVVLAAGLAVAILLGLTLNDPTLVGVMAVLFMWIGVTSSWNVVVGYAGIFSFGQLAFFGAGTYVTGLLTSHADVSPWVDTVAAALAGGALALLLGLAVLRLRGVYVALATLAFHQLLLTLIVNDTSGFTGGVNGIAPIAPYFPTGSLLGQSRSGYWTALAGGALVLLAVIALLRSPVGLAALASRDAEAVAAARGVHATKYRMIAFAFSGAAASTMGAVYAHYVGAVSPTVFSFATLMMLFAMIIVGGWGTLWGPAIGAIALTAVDHWVSGEFPDQQALIFACVLLTAVLFLPGGFVRSGQEVGHRLRAGWSNLE